MRPRIWLMGILIGVFGSSTVADSAVWYVSASVASSGDGSTWETAFKTIQEGIESSSDGDTVTVAEETYTENVHFRGKNITLRSTDPLSPTVVARTILDGGKNGPVVTFSGTENETCVLSGFSIQDGSAVCGGGICGGTQEVHSHATIRNSVIARNEVAGYWPDGCGGGVAFCDGTVEDNTISDNSAGGYGGGLYECQGMISHNLISGNVAEQGGGGLSNCNGAIEGNAIRGNTAAGYSGSGGGLALCDGIIQNNTISGNAAAGTKGSGGGASECDGILQNNLIIGNAANADGGGIFVCRGTVQSNTIYGNWAAKNGGGVSLCKKFIRNCIIWANTAGGAGAQTYESNTPSSCCIQNWTETGRGNIASGPRFVNEANANLRLRSDSPCRDAGANFYWLAWPQRDLDGNCRLAGQRQDIGCYEYGSSLDSDGDLLSDADEMARASEPTVEDTDGDSLRDGLEVLRGTNPIESTPPGIIYVPRDIPTIQASLSLARNGDEVRVGPGTYNVSIQFCGADVVLRGFGSASTILAGDFGPVVSFLGSETEACVLSDFAIQNGRAELGAGICGGTWDKHTRATIRNNVIADNTADSGGGGIAHCDGVIENNRIARNSGGYFAGGMTDCNGLIRNNKIYGNTSEHWGGGVDSCNGTIQNNEVYGNSATTSGAGLYGCNGFIVNNRIYGNSAATVGGGLSACSGIIMNNEISGNSAGDGGGLSGCNGAILNNTICNNTGGYGAGLYNCSGTVRNCILWGNRGWSSVSQISGGANVSYSCIHNWTGGGPGNIAADPLFVDPTAGNSRLQAASPCIDTGINHFWPVWPQRDLDGNCRLVGQRVDMGCYEFDASPDSDGDLLSDDAEAAANTDPNVEDSDGDGLRDGLEVLRGSDPTAVTPPRVIHIPSGVPTIQEALSLAIKGDEIIVSPRVYHGNVCFAGVDVVLRSSTPLGPSIVTSTILDGGELGSVVSFQGDETEACVLSGFTIKNGEANSGGGICGGTEQKATHATIENNVIADNSAWSGGGVSYCNGVLRSNKITGNSAQADGGGVANCAGIIEGNTVSGNSAGWGGGGFYKCDGIIRGNTIHANSCPSGDGGGGGLWSCQAVIENNRITDNWAEFGGGGLSSCSGAIRSNLIAGNSCGSSYCDGHGGGLYNCNGAILNNTIVVNSALGRRGEHIQRSRLR